MDQDRRHVVILGAGHAGGSVAASLRQVGFAGAITLVGEEPLPPYQRPPLSKAWLSGAADEESVMLKPAEFYAEHKIELRLNTRAVELDRERALLKLQDGELLPYDVLVVATGSRAILLPVAGAELDGVMALRTAADAEKLKAVVGPGKRLIVVGGGYVGLEVAASARKAGAEVVVVEREGRLLARVACGALADFFHQQHTEHGVTLRLGSTITGFVGVEGRVTEALLSDGSSLPCDAVVIGVGVRPNVEIAQAAGLECSNGIVVDLDSRTSDPNIYAIGDVTNRPMPIYDRMFRMESVPNALEQAKQAAHAIAGLLRPAGEVPWQWSDQYDLKLQIAGYPFEADEIVLRGNPEAKKFALFHLKGNLVQAVEAVNSPPDFMIGRQLIGKRTPIDKNKLTDTTVSLREVVA